MPTLICPGMAQLRKQSNGWQWKFWLQIGDKQINEGMVEHRINGLPGLPNEPNPMPFATRDEAIVWYKSVVEPVLVLTDIV